MGVDEAALTVTMTVSPVLYVAVFAASQMLSVDCAWTFITAVNAKMTARINVFKYLMKISRPWGAQKSCAPHYG